ncbi:MAG TPA: ABC transporter ATP-binding protein [Coriobacteriia bacterium]|nr:ABC transporter ATP-binding protein [Coriobacteriia bacterium]
MPDGATTAVRAQGLSKQYGSGSTLVTALTDATFEILQGEFVVLLGPSGSGKTTLLNLVGALESPTAGEVEVFGTPLAQMGEDERTRYRLNTVGFIFQFFNLVPTLTAAENVALLAELTGPDTDRRTQHVLEQVGLGDRGDHFPSQMSGGEQQRISIARGLVKGSPLLLCDEPTGALDIETGVRVLSALDDAVRSDGRTVVVVTHNAVIARMADRVIRLRDGKIISAETNETRIAPEELNW